MAILLVLLYHYVFLTSPAPQGRFAYHLRVAFQIGWTGVDLFFVLSGFLIGGILMDARSSPRYFKTFYLRRVFRILPIYYIWIGLYFVLAYAAPVGWGRNAGIAQGKWTIIPTYALFLQNVAWSRGKAFRTAWLAGLWSLAVEEQFYLVAPSVVRFFSKQGLVKALVLTIACAPLVRILVFKYIVPRHGAAPYILTPCRADALAMGVLLAVVWREDNCKKWMRDHIKFLYGVVGVLFAGVLCLIATGWSQYSYGMAVWGYSCIDAFFAGLIIVALVVPKGTWASVCRLPILINVGRVSYCMYIIHSVANDVCHFAPSAPFKGVSTLLSLTATVAAVGLTWLVAKLSWRYLESPLIRLGHRYRY